MGNWVTGIEPTSTGKNWEGDRRPQRINCCACAGELQMLPATPGDHLSQGQAAAGRSGARKESLL